MLDHEVGEEATKEEDSLELFDTVCHSGFLLSTENKHDTFETLKVAKNSLIGTIGMMIMLVLFIVRKKRVRYK